MGLAAFKPWPAKTPSRANPPARRPASHGGIRENPRRYDRAASSGSVVGNDPVNHTDPTGTDEIDVFRPFAFGLAYHEAEYVGNDKTGWTYISKDGAVNGSASGPAKPTFANFPSLKAALTDAGRRGYAEGYRHGATPKQDAANIKAATAAAKSDYDVLKCNCGHAVQAGERAAGTPGYRDNRSSPESANPKEAAKYEASPQGQRGGWRPVIIPKPPTKPEQWR